MDMDGYGVAEEAVEACLQPLATSAVAGDCDDDDRAVHPGAEEHCDDRDEDCDDDDASSFPGAEEICGDRADNDCAGDGDTACRLVGEVDLADAAAKLLGDRAGELSGTRTWIGGDSNADGTVDLAVMATGQFCTGKDIGARVYLLTEGPHSDADLTDADAVLYDEDRSLSFYSAFGVVPDLDGDGNDDLVVGATLNNTVYVHFGPISGPRDLDDSDLDITRPTIGSLGGGLAAPGDMDGDCWNDILLGGPGRSGKQAFLFLGPVTADRTTDDAAATMSLSSRQNYSYLGLCACGGDVNGDGLPDVALGAPGSGMDHGAVYVVHGPLTGDLLLADEGDQLDAAAARFEGEQSQDAAGNSVDCSGDVNADGRADILIGAHHNNSDEDSHGTAYLITSPTTGTVSLALADWSLSGASAGDSVGSTLSSGSDLDADGLSDIAVGAFGVGEDVGARSTCSTAPSRGT